jgi:hypothetical protein
MGNKYQYNRKTRQAQAFYFAKHARLDLSTLNTPLPTTQDLLSDTTHDLLTLQTLNQLYPVFSRVYFC